VAAGTVALAYGFPPGTRVAGTSHSGCGYCRMCRTGRYNLCFNYGREELGHRQYGHYTQGAYAEYVVQTIKSVFPIPDTMPFDVAALCDTASIALHSVKRAGIEPGDVVASVGSGGMGLLAAMFAKALGAARVIVVGGGKRLDRARALGFETVDYHSADPVGAVRELTGGRGADVSIDSAGTTDSIRQSIAVLRKGGRVAFTGIPKEPVQIDFQKIVLEELDLYGVRANRNTMEEVIPLMADGRIPAAKLITHHFKLADFTEAFRTFNERVDGALKVIVEP
jgi:L-iditol 2-dehydrogenase